MSTKTRLKAIQKAAITRVKSGQPISEIVIYGESESGETRLLDTIILENHNRPGVRVYLPANGRRDNDNQDPN